MSPASATGRVEPSTEERLRRRLERERKARHEAERISEAATRALFDRQQELALLGAVASAANDATGMGEVIQLTLGRVCSHLGFPIGHAYLRDTDGMLTPTGIWHIEDAGRTEPFRELTERTRFAPDEGLPGRVLASAEPTFITDVRVDGNFPRVREAERCGIRGALAFPILVGARTEGVLEFFSYQDADPDASLMALVHQLGTQLGRLIERIRAQERFAHQATHDPLTGLANRVLFQDRLDQALEQRRGTEATVAVCFVDLDRFKALNDNFGHEAGDEVLRVAAERLESQLNPADTAARLGGDEFVVLFVDVEGDADAVRRVGELHDALSEPCEVDGRPYNLNASIGVAVGTEADPDVLMRDADAAMYRAKERGRGRYEFCDEAMRRLAMRRAEVERDLDLALERGELELHYQPIVALGSGEIAAVEALLRWHHPERGMVSPAEFVAIAEESGQILAIGAWVIEAACRQAVAWRTELGDAAPMPITVNLSPRQLASADLGDIVESTLARTGCDVGDLAIELTESAALANGELAVATLERLRAFGVQVLLDDFGTGYSSLNHIRRLPIDTVKIDGSFVRELGSSQEATAIVAAIVGMAGALGLGVIAEGAETEEQAVLASELGCGYGQGYHFSRPMAPAQLIAERVRGRGAASTRTRSASFQASASPSGAASASASSVRP